MSRATKAALNTEEKKRALQKDAMQRSLAIKAGLESKLQRWNIILLYLQRNAATHNLATAITDTLRSPQPPAPMQTDNDVATAAANEDDNADEATPQPDNGLFDLATLFGASDSNGATEANEEQRAEQVANDLAALFGGPDD